MRNRFSRYLMGVVALLTAATLVGTATPASAKPGKGGEATAASALAIPGVCGGYYTGSWPPPTIRRGSVDTVGSSAVKLAQCYLNNSIESSYLAVDGNFGSQTDATTRFFQSASCANVPPVDGIIGRNTWNALRYWANGAYWAC